MYDSGISAVDLIESVSEEADISIPIGSLSWYRWLNAVEQFVYAEILKEYRAHTFDADGLVDGKIDLKNVPTSQDCASVCFDDVIKIYADDTELDKVSVISGLVFTDKPSFYPLYDGTIQLNLTDTVTSITVVYRLRPALKAPGKSANVNLPIEFVDMAAARLRGEAYKIANEDGLSGKWLADYNTQLESFKIWAAARNERYGE